MGHPVKKPALRPGRGLVAAAALVALVCVPGALSAQQEELAAGCATAQPAAVRQFCNLVAEAIEIAQPRVGLAATAGNPVPGTASTLGMRLGAIPRVSVAARVTGVWVDLPPIRDIGGTKMDGMIVPALGANAAVGVLRGFSPAPTVGGVGSLDLLGSFSVIPVPEGEGFRDDSPVAWGIGARVGLLRESFTVPGISISGMYHRLSNFEFGDPTFAREASFFDVQDYSVLSARAAISKQLLVFGLAAGVGYDRYSSDVRFGVQGLGSPIAVEGFSTDRVMAFANATLSFLILHLVAEAGWQSGADDIGLEIPANVDSDVENGSFFGSIAVRLAI